MFELGCDDAGYVEDAGVFCGVLELRGMEEMRGRERDSLVATRGGDGLGEVDIGANAGDGAGAGGESARSCVVCFCAGTL